MGVPDAVGRRAQIADDALRGQPGCATASVPSVRGIPNIREGRNWEIPNVVLGDSLTAGYGLDPGQAFPDVLQRKIDAAGLGFEVVNMGVSGDTSAGGG